MTLKMQFDDLVRQLKALNTLGEEDDGLFLNCVNGSRVTDEKQNSLKDERKRLKKIVESKKKRLQKLKAKFKLESSKLEEEKQKTLEAKEQRNALESVLLEIRHLILSPNNSSAQLLSILDSISMTGE